MEGVRSVALLGNVGSGIALLIKVRLIGMPAEETGLPMEDNAMSCSGPCYLDSSLYICAPP